jgi:hypothetical protein
MKNIQFEEKGRPAFSKFIRQNRLLEKQTCFKLRLAPTNVDEECGYGG